LDWRDKDTIYYIENPIENVNRCRLPAGRQGYRIQDAGYLSPFTPWPLFPLSNLERGPGGEVVSSQVANLIKTSSL